jgi:hypothetical protein
MISQGREDRVLATIEARLRRESPDLVARFTVFERLVQDEGPPPPERPRY